MSRPEHLNPPEVFYNEEESKKYAANTRMIEIQSAMTDRAIELLNLPEDRSFYILDIGCGSGLSGEVLSAHGHMWVGCDISPSMLNVAVAREVEGDLFLSDIGQGLYFRPASFDGAISVSVLQWLLNADKRTHNPKQRLTKFFQSLYNCLKRGARAVFQFYPESGSAIEMISSSALQCGFGGGVVVDYPNSTKAKKYFLVLFAGMPNPEDLPKALTGEEPGHNRNSTIRFSGNGELRIRSKKRKKGVKDREWIQKKKQSMRRKGIQVAADSKYTGRKRRRAL
ncbi:18S rRNA (guanine(1575)-N(7))-methyltransferase Bud23 C-terminal domain-containing protein [Plasmodiophora brassicae]|uniref:18S rRNA (guanine(1575)-N(7))-methyltransferase Bud23 C-terminal domain-containing protein n=2 Tax=Plasmodiophora brassicae TaxID=37360 RepID=A0A3P3Y927_PLABS|nr:unnamed protein product [Plasmodiophora brassicae]